MKKFGILAVLLLCIAAILTAGCISQDEPVDYATALIGDWESDKLYETNSGVKFHMMYHFTADNMGTATAEVNGETLATTVMGWGYLSDNKYIIASAQTGAGEYYVMSEDGKRITNEFGETFRKL